MFKETVDFIKSQFPAQDFIPLHEPRFLGNEKKYLIDCVDSTFVSSVGMYVDEFEKRMAAYSGARYAVAAVNGTAALHMAMIVAGVKENEIVITQPLSFIATCNAIAYIGASHLFVDVDFDTMGLSPSKLKEYLEAFAEKKADGFFYHKTTGQRIAACVPMHTFGHPCRIDELAALCEEYNIALVEDAAESIGSYYRDKHTGTTGLLGTFSFNGNKTITCGGGGAIVTNDEALAKKAKYLTTQAKVPHRWNFVHDEIGYNYRMPNINAALMCAQMEQLDGFLANKRELAQLYLDFFKGTEIKFVEEPAGSTSNYWLCAVLLSDSKRRDEFLQFSNDNGVMTRPSWTLMNKLVMFKDALCGNLDNAEELESRLVNIPSSVRINKQ
ncbi:MAG: putative PLP-dependent enzyme involved in cell wall biosis [Bacteroidetes bacterium]|nr:putative PLP-dependent enzyme involved in cell wall biosis [Bacteroidota bacterium]